MKVGVPTEIKTDEYRVAITPSGVRELTDRGHEVVIQSGAGEGSTITDADYEAQGARILPDADAVFGEAELILKVKEPQPEEVARLRPHHTLFTYLHLAPDPELTQGLMASGATCIAYETVEDAAGPAAAARADERGRRQDRDAGRRVHAREAARRARRAARRRARRRGRQGHGHRRRRRRDERGVHRDRHAGRGLRLRPQHRPAARARAHPRLPRVDGVLERRSRSSSACPRWTSSSARCSSPAPARRSVITREQLGLMKQQRGAGRRRDRPGRLLRDVAPDDALRPDLRGRRHHALLRGEHARRGAGHVDVRADERDDAVRRSSSRRRACTRRSSRTRGFMLGLNVAAGQVTYEPVARDQGLEYLPPAEALQAVPVDPVNSAGREAARAHPACLVAARRPPRPPASRRSSRTTALLLHQPREQVAEAMQQHPGARRRPRAADGELVVARARAPTRRSSRRASTPPTRPRTSTSAGSASTTRCAWRARTASRVSIDIGFWAPLWATADEQGPRARTAVDPQALRRVHRRARQALRRRRSAPPVAGRARRRQPSRGRAGARPRARRRPPPPAPAARAQPREPAPAEPTPLPKVDRFTLWNEPNHQALLHAAVVAGRQAARARRSTARWSWPRTRRRRARGPTRRSSSATPRARAAPTDGDGPVAPLRFLRELACVDDAAAAAHRRRLRGLHDAARRRLGAPPVRAQPAARLGQHAASAPTTSSSATCRGSRATLDALAAAGRIGPGGARDPRHRVRLRDRAARRPARRPAGPPRAVARRGASGSPARSRPSRRGRSSCCATSRPRPRRVSESLRRPFGQFWTGLLDSDGREKLAAQTFRAGLVAERRGRKALTLWGRLRLGDGPRRVAIERSVLGRPWRALARTPGPAAGSRARSWPTAARASRAARATCAARATAWSSTARPPVCRSTSVGQAPKTARKPVGRQPTSNIRPDGPVERRPSASTTPVERADPWPTRTEGRLLRVPRTGRGHGSEPHTGRAGRVDAVAARLPLRQARREARPRAHLRDGGARARRDHRLQRPPHRRLPGARRSRTSSPSRARGTTASTSRRSRTRRTCRSASRACARSTRASTRPASRGTTRSTARPAWSRTATRHDPDGAKRDVTTHRVAGRLRRAQPGADRRGRRRATARSTRPTARTTPR